MIGKLGFLFLTIGDVAHESTWTSFFSEANRDIDHVILVHSKNRLSADSFFKPFELDEKVDTKWENTILAQDVLLRHALTHGVTHFIFVSESTIPLLTFGEVYKQLTEDPRSRFHYYFPEHNRAFPPLTQDKIPKHSQWVILNRHDAMLCVNDVELLKIMSRGCIDNEHYYGTCLLKHGCLNESEICRRDETLCIWDDGGAHPHTFTYPISQDPYLERLKHTIKTKSCMFARKFDKHCDLSDIWI